MKKLGFLLIMLLITSGFSGCTGQKHPQTLTTHQPLLTIVARVGTPVSCQCYSGQASGTDT